MLQPPDEFSPKLFVDQNIAEEFECAICSNAFKDPVQACKNGHTFCRGCLQKAMESKDQCPNCNVKLTSESISSNLAVKNLMGKAPVHCFTRLQSLEVANISTGSSIPEAVTKKSKLDQCTWTGKLDDSKSHFNECPYAGTICRFGCGEVVRRIDMPEHEASVCPRRRAVPCTNAGCNAVMPAESMLAAHKANDCPYQRIDCPFSTVGCNEHLLRKDIDSHNAAHAEQHNRLLMLGIQSLRQDVQSLRQDNRSLREDNLSFRQDNLSLQQKVVEHEERLNRQHHEIIFKIRLRDLTQDGLVDMSSRHKNVGAYNAWLRVKKGFCENGDHCGVHLHLGNGPFPCRVTCTFEIPHWDSMQASVHKDGFTHTYEGANNMGFSQIMRLEKLYGASSPYVRDGYVTFIAIFQILTLE